MNIQTLTNTRTQAWVEAASQSTSDNNYKGLTAHSRAGLHAHVAALVQQHVPKGASILDIAAGSGAFALRLSDLGYRMSATDYVATNFRIAEKIPFQAADLNLEFGSALKAQDAITAMEIIEHLENPRHFMRQCRKLLSVGGTCIVSSPNPNSPVAKAYFLRTNHFTWFTPDDYRVQGHIAPLSIAQVEPIAKESGFTVVDLHTFGDSFDNCANSPRLRYLAKFVGMLDASPEAWRGDIWTVVLRAV